MSFIIDNKYEGQHKVDDEILDSIFNAANWFSWLRIYHKKMFNNIFLYDIFSLFLYHNKLFTDAPTETNRQLLL